MKRDYLTLMTRPGHWVVVKKRHNHLCGDTWQPVCIEDGCRYVGPHVPEQRAHAIAEEHRRKSIGSWRPAQ